MKKNLKLPVTFEQIEKPDFNTEGLLPARIKVAHSGLNLNDSTFSKESMDGAEDSLKNRPLLAYVQKTDGKNDFAGHELEYTLEDGEVKIVYLEYVIGIIPETNNYEIVEEDGKYWVYVDAYIFEDYMTDEVDIFKENSTKSVSMEIVVNDYAVDENNKFEIKQYRYTGVTVLGDRIQEAMLGANIQVQFSDKSMDEEIIKRVAELNEKLAYVSTQNSEPDTHEPETFELTFRNKMEMAEAIIYEEYKESDDWTWVKDMNDTYVFFCLGEKDYRASYSIEEGVMNIDLFNKEEVFTRHLTQGEIEQLEANEVAMAEELRSLNTELETVKSEFTEVSEQLEVFKAKEAEELEAQRKFNIDEVISDFEKDLKGTDEFEVIKQNPYTYENSEKLEKELLLIYARLNRKGNTTKAKPKTFAKVSVKIKEENSQSSGRYGDAEKYFTKNEEE